MKNKTKNELKIEVGALRSAIARILSYSKRRRRTSDLKRYLINDLDQIEATAEAILKFDPLDFTRKERAE